SVRSWCDTAGWLMPTRVQISCTQSGPPSTRTARIRSRDGSASTLKISESSSTCSWAATATRRKAWAFMSRCSYMNGPTAAARQAGDAKITALLMIDLRPYAKLPSVVLLKDIIRRWWGVELAIADARGYVLDHADGKIVPPANDLCRAALFSKEGF